MPPSWNTLIKQSTLEIKTSDKYVNTIRSNLKSIECEKTCNARRWKIH